MIIKILLGLFGSLFLFAFVASYCVEDEDDF